MTEKKTFNDEDYISKAFKNAGFDKIPNNELIRIVINKIMLRVPNDQILSVIKKNASEKNYVTAQKIIEINELIGIGRVSKTKTFNGVDKLLEEARRKAISVHYHYYK